MHTKCWGHVGKGLAQLVLSGRLIDRPIGHLPDNPPALHAALVKVMDDRRAMYAEPPGEVVDGCTLDVQPRQVVHLVRRQPSLHRV